MSSPSTLTPTAKTIPPHSVPTAAARGHRLQIRLRPPSGLGNQLFQYAASLYFAQRYHADLKILHEPETRNLSQEHPRFFLLDRFRIKTPMRFVHLLDRVLCTPQVTRLSVTTLTRTHVHRAQSFANNWTFVPELLFPKATRRLYIDDYFLCYQYAAAVEEALRHELQFRDAPSGQNALVLEHIASELHPVSLHVRRGDYKGFGDDAMLPMQYYRDAMSALRASLPEATFFIFSDDIDFCRANLPDGGRYIFVDHNDQAHAHEDLRLMAACHHHIIANSTFSWWGAWLNPRRDKQVIAPDRWLDPRYPHPDICPPNWTIISSAPKAT